MKKIYPQLSVLLSASFSIILLFTFSKSALSQDFITEWTFTEDAPMIRFNALSTGDVNYNWTTRPSNLSGEGSFSRIEPDLVTIELDIEEGDTLTLNIAPENLTRFFSKSESSNDKLIDVIQWGAVKWTSMDSAFYYRELVNFSATDVPDLSKVRGMRSMFRGASSFNSDISNWDVSYVSHMGSMFEDAISFNQDINNWDISNVQILSSMFKNAISFNQDIGDWDLKKVNSMGGMFSGATTFNQDISTWNTSNIYSVSSMFSYATSFNQDISTWNTRNFNSLNFMFYGATSFNQDLSNWNVSYSSDFTYTFMKATSFNQDISGWDYNPEAYLYHMLDSSGIDCATYSKIILGWKNNYTFNQVKIKHVGVKGLEYPSSAEADRKYLRDQGGWHFLGDRKTEEDCSGTVNTNGHTLNDNEIVLYPNPTYNSITIEAGGKELEGLSVLNANGQDVSGLVTIQRSGNSANLDLARLSPGVYVLRTVSNTTKVIKM